MALGDMNIRVGADIKELEDGMRRGGDSVEKFTSRSKKAILGTAGSFNALNKSSNSAAFALTNLGRVAQDLPFGFVGIQNNLNPLLESFQRLKAESGSSGKALKALAGSLVGAGGIGLALSVASSAILLFQNGMANFSKKSTAVSDEVAKANQKLADSYRSIVTSAADEASRVAVIVEQIKQEVLTRKQRAAAIEELKRISPEYFSLLDKEKSTIEDITRSYNLYTSSILKAIEAKAKEQNLSKVTERIIDLQTKGKRLSEDQVGANGKIIRSNISRMASEEDLEEELKKGTTTYEKYQRTLSGTAGLSLREIRELNELLQTQAILVQDLAKTASKDFKIAGDPKGSVKDLETIEEVLEKLRIKIDFLNRKGIVLNTNETPAKIAAIESAIEHLLQKFKLDPDNAIIINLEGRINDLQLTEQFKKVLKGDRKVIIPFEFFPEPKTLLLPTNTERDIRNALQAELDKMNIKVGINGLRITAGSSLDELQKTTAAAKTELGKWQESVAELNTAIVSSFAAAVASLATGGEGLAGIFEALLGTIGDFLIKMGEGAIKAAFLAKAIKKIAAYPQLAIIAGVAAIIAGNIIKNFKVPGFAGGVQNFGGGLAIVGERGPELVNLPRGSDVIPNHAMSGSIGGGQFMQVEVIGRLRGNDIYVSNQRTTITRGRNS